MAEYKQMADTLEINDRRKINGKTMECAILEVKSIGTERTTTHWISTTKHLDVIRLCHQQYIISHLLPVK